MGKSITNLSSVTTVGLDLAKHVFQVHSVDASGRVVVAKAIRRNKLLEFFASLPPCLVGLEACGSAHHWARELIKLGHDARMMPPAYVKPLSISVSMWDWRVLLRIFRFQLGLEPSPSPN
jgi:transposase